MIKPPGYLRLAYLCIDSELPGRVTARLRPHSPSCPVAEAVVLTEPLSGESRLIDSARLGQACSALLATTIAVVDLPSHESRLYNSESARLSQPCPTLLLPGPGGLLDAQPRDFKATCGGGGGSSTL